MVEDDSDTEPLDLDPELAKVAAAFKTKHPPTTKPSADPSSDADPSSVGEVRLRIKWIPHPEDETGKEERYEFIQKRVRATVSRPEWAVLC